MALIYILLAVGIFYGIYALYRDKVSQEPEQRDPNPVPKRGPGRPPYQDEP